MRNTTLYIFTTALLLASTLSARPVNYFAEGTREVKAKDYKSAFKTFTEGVNAGDPRSMDYMGWLYLEGKGVRQSVNIAEGYFREGAALGSEQACRNLGNIYYDGRAVNPSAAEAVKWWQKAVELGSPRAAFSLATILYTGVEYPQDKPRALEIWRKAADEGHTTSAAALIFAEAEEDLSRINPDKLRPLAEKGCSSAKNLLRLVELKKAGDLDFYFPGPFEQQAHNFCAIASTTMLLRWSGVKITHFDTAKARPDHQWGQGSRWPEMAAVAKSYKRTLTIHSHPYTDAGFKEGVKEVVGELQSGRPLVIDILATADSPSAHSILLVGYSKETKEFIFRNSALPFPGLEALPTDKFKELWRSKGFIPDNETLLRAYMKLNP